MIRARLPRWTKQPVFGVLVLLVVAVVLVIHGEPQPSSRPSGTSVVVSGTPTVPATSPDLLLVAEGRLYARVADRLHAVALPAGVVGTSVVSSRGLNVLLGVQDGRQHAYAITKSFAVRDLGYADAVLPAAGSTAAVWIETALVTPGLLPEPSATASPTSKATGVSGGGADDEGADDGGSGNDGMDGDDGQPPLRDYLIRRYDAAGHPVGEPVLLPPGSRAAVDTAVGLVVWQPTNRVFDGDVARESLSAEAALLRPDHSIRLIGAVQPLAASSSELLVWDVAHRRFGLMPLRYVTATVTTTASAAATTTASAATGDASASSMRPRPSPSTVAGTRWYEPTRGFVVTGPAAFNADGSAFAVYAQVGARRRLAVALPTNAGSDRVDVLALNEPASKSSRPPGTAAASSSGAGSAVATAAPAAAGSQTASASGSADSPATGSGADDDGIAPDGFPLSAPLMPLWWQDSVTAVGADGRVVNYTADTRTSVALDLGIAGIQSLAVLD